MSQVINEEEADVVCLGMGFMSGVVAAELASAGYKVVGITKGPYWDYATDYSSTKYDEWGVGLGRKYDSPLPMQSVTIRNESGQFALPVRRYTMPIQSHALGHGVGGAGQHQGGNMGRQGPWGYMQSSLTIAAYGQDFLNAVNPNNDLEDWPLTYDQYEPYYLEWEQAHGLCGIDNGPLVPMSENYPMRPHPLTPLGSLFMSTAESLGYSPFPHVSALASEAYTNQYGVQSNPCVYEGYCGGPCDYACQTGAKANSAYRTVPAAMSSGNFTLVLNSFIFRLDADQTTGLVTDARYYDAQGNVHIQPGKVFFNGLWGYNLIRLMLLSGTGSPYNPTALTGSVGRGLTNGHPPYTGTTVSGVLTKMGANAYAAGNGSGGGVDIYDLMDDTFDHTGLNFIGGNQVSFGAYPGGSPGNIAFAGSVTSASWGSTFKAAQKGKFLPTKTSVSSTPFAHDLPTTTHFADLDPHYVDGYDDPVARLTYDWTPNTFNGATYLANNQVGQIIQALGAQDVTVSNSVPPGSAHNDWWGHHLRGGCRIGLSATTSVWNLWNQCWTAQNLFGAGEITNTCGDSVPSGTHVAGPQSYVAADGIQAYLNGGGLLS